MHTFEGKECTIQHIGDCSGDVRITSKSAAQAGEYLEIPCEDILGFALNYVKLQLISHFEQIDLLELIRKTL